MTSFLSVSALRSLETEIMQIAKQNLKGTVDGSLLGVCKKNQLLLTSKGKKI
jgi:hypothetical protein